METNTYMKHKKVIDESRATLVKAQKIRNSKEFKSAIMYFQLQKQRGNIRRPPSLANGYKIEE